MPHDSYFKNIDIELLIIYANQWVGQFNNIKFNRIELRRYSPPRKLAQHGPQEPATLYAVVFMTMEDENSHSFKKLVEATLYYQTVWPKHYRTLIDKGFSNIYHRECFPTDKTGKPLKNYLDQWTFIPLAKSEKLPLGVDNKTTPIVLYKHDPSDNYIWPSEPAPYESTDSVIDHYSVLARPEQHPKYYSNEYNDRAINDALSRGGFIKLDRLIYLLAVDVSTSQLLPKLWEKAGFNHPSAKSFPNWDDSIMQTNFGRARLWCWILCRFTMGFKSSTHFGNIQKKVPLTERNFIPVYQVGDKGFERIQKFEDIDCMDEDCYVQIKEVEKNLNIRLAIISPIERYQSIEKAQWDKYIEPIIRTHNIMTKGEYFHYHYFKKDIDMESIQLMRHRTMVLCKKIDFPPDGIPDGTPNDLFSGPDDFFDLVVGGLHEKEPGDTKIISKNGQVVDLKEVFRCFLKDLFDEEALPEFLGMLRQDGHTMWYKFSHHYDPIPRDEAKERYVWEKHIKPLLTKCGLFSDFSYGFVKGDFKELDVWKVQTIACDACNGLGSGINEIFDIMDAIRQGMSSESESENLYKERLRYFFNKIFSNDKDRSKNPFEAPNLLPAFLEVFSKKRALSGEDPINGVAEEKSAAEGKSIDELILEYGTAAERLYDCMRDHLKLDKKNLKNAEKPDLKAAALGAFDANPDAFLPLTEGNIESEAFYETTEKQKRLTVGMIIKHALINNHPDVKKNFEALYARFLQLRKSK